MNRSTAPSGLTRAALMRRAAAAAGAAAGGAAVLAVAAAPGESKPSAAQDKKILAAALVLEDLQAAFYARALRDAGLSGEQREFARTVGDHERAHAAFIRKALGADAKPPPKFDFGETTADAHSFATAAQQLEDVGLAVLNGQGPNLTPATLAAAAKIVSVEARHASWIRDISGAVPAPAAVDVGLSVKEGLARVRAMGIVIS
ncbi:MAG TPA: ferritin-like domain-containing protein [Solirubrobacteraceae bacterium]|nr:ferritin-like domain-containing protein [Solirubrobacteraceae bacterium]